MSYCLNPTCQNPQNPGDAEFCQSCGSKLLLTNEQSPSASRYRTIKPIAQGGFGRTFLAVDETKPQTFGQCVIKQFFPQNTAAEKAAQLFHQEAAQLETLGKHPQIPELIAHFEQEGRQYLVQEFIDGKNLAQELEQKGAFTETQIRQILNDLLPVIHFVHKSKVIHRDIKPENIIRRRLSPAPLPALENSYQPSPFQKDIVLVDFGAAKKVTATGLPQTGTIIGSAAYTAPEQLMGKAVFASDIYSLGVTCIHLLTHIPPFDLFEGAEDSWAWRNYLKSAVSDDFGRILDTMLQSATNRRYNSASAVIRQLNPKPVYLDAQPVLDAPETSAESKPALAPAPALLGREQQAEIQQALQEAIAPYNVTIQLSQAKQKLNIVINRTQDNPIHYPHLSQIIATKLTALQLDKVATIKLLGRVNNSRVPEWKEVLQIDPKIQLKNKLVRLQHNQLAKKIAPIATQEFWLPKLKTQDFWLDSLMFALVWFIFGSQIVIFNSWFALIVASGFMVVKHQVSQDKEFANKNLFASLVVLFLITGGMGNSRILNTGIFGILLGCLVVALPLFFVKENYQ
ncbi:MAG: serine/threonine protein kinase [Microcoleus sp. PH2017_15_JOR_U_A]|uniref:serine/threonine-protein kinase n=1 Tax=Microcoleus sp. PH2017_15_JOR_U_A TaxID=2798826 RepID=UPI001D9DAED8|nr:serine/threonine-protein kinase [Microcoleus sp. PH2017_15_JOR_U_A]MCC3497644.1 serine/threonine protein kinase [Microcoleus sp. PH2017_15_JOR_U_A]